MQIRKARLLISSYIEDLDTSGLPTGEPEKSEAQVLGSIAKRADGSVTLSYEEESEGGKVFCDMLLAEKKVTVLRRGEIESTLVFDEGTIHRSLYTLPPYSFDMEMFTKKIRCSMTDLGGKLELIYIMKVGGAERSCRMKIEAAAEGV